MLLTVLQDQQETVYLLLDDMTFSFYFLNEQQSQKANQ